MNLNIVIVEDQDIEAQRLINELTLWSSSKNFSVSIKKYSSGEEYFLSSDTHTALVFFLDIQLPGINGLQVATRLRKEHFNGHIIFLTAFHEYVFEGYHVHALNYLLKPIESSALVPCMDEIAQSLIGNNYIFRNKQEIIQIPYQEILAFSRNYHYVDILTKSETFCQRTSLKNILTHLPKEFIQTHRCYIVNMTHIKKIVANTIELSNHLTVQIGRQYINSVRMAFANYSVRFDIK